MLDEKLKAVFEKHISSGDYPDEFDALLVDVKQAFRETGWRNLGEHTSYECHVDCRLMYGVMTGQSWYDRFEKESDPKVSGAGATQISVSYAAVLEAAKKAAGLSEPKKRMQEDMWDEQPISDKADLDRGY
jgi:hypothetical protein